MFARARFEVVEIETQRARVGVEERRCVLRGVLGGRLKVLCWVVLLVEEWRLAVVR
jgi:hypothetical protein